MFDDNNFAITNDNKEQDFSGVTIDTVRNYSCI